MFKIFYRILIILLVAGIVSGGLYLFFNSSLGSSLIGGQGGFGDRGGFPGGQATIGTTLLSQFQSGGQALGGDFGGHGDQGVVDVQRGLAGLLSNFFKIGAIVSGVVLVRWLISLVWRKRPNRVTAA
ncbi:MAG TPA: hypothetical protein VF806_04080 [Anaerolineaceae bacterium]